MLIATIFNGALERIGRKLFRQNARDKSPDDPHRETEDSTFLDTSWLSQQLTSLAGPAGVENPEPLQWHIPSLAASPDQALQISLSYAQDQCTAILLKLTKPLPTQAPQWRISLEQDGQWCAQVTLNKRQLKGPLKLILRDHEILTQAIEGLALKPTIQHIELQARPQAQSIVAHIHPSAGPKLAQEVRDLSMALKLVPTPSTCDELQHWLTYAQSPLALTPQTRAISARALEHIDALLNVARRPMILQRWAQEQSSPLFWLNVMERLGPWEPWSALPPAKNAQLLDRWVEQGLLSAAEAGEFATRMLTAEQLRQHSSAAWHKSWCSSLARRSLSKLGRSRTKSPNIPTYTHIESLVSAHSTWLHVWPSHRLPDPPEQDPNDGIHALRQLLYEQLHQPAHKVRLEAIQFIGQERFILASDLLLKSAPKLLSDNIQTREQLLSAYLETLKSWLDAISKNDLYSPADMQAWEDLLLEHSLAWMGWDETLCEVLARLGGLPTLKAMSQLLQEQYGVKAEPTPAMWELARRLEDRVGALSTGSLTEHQGALSITDKLGALTLKRDSH